MYISSCMLADMQPCTLSNADLSLGKSELHENRESRLPGRDLEEAAWVK